ncbi:MAG: 1-deoxy-D-xylulose 5-phosphate reductoisomerase [Candidatus Omnitrophica bacterium]|nr:1-deoxy-D-xylulose 5-phosphate reductoisomerase [Candidatus Omnitrophota bacterium]
MRTLTILGSTGSIGRNALEVVRAHRDRIRVKGLAAASNAALLAEQAREFGAESVYLKSGASDYLQAGGPGKVFSSAEGLDSFVEACDADILLAAASGTESLGPVVAAIRRGRRVAVANKEVLVAAGGLIVDELERHPSAELIPVDSEHSAIFQCLEGHDLDGVERILLTSSGGPLKDVPPELFGGLTKDQVLNHPRWKMGPKITVDSATLMNKGLEVIEAAVLFGLPVERVDVLVHPEAVVHSMVEMRDGSVLAQLGVTDMRLPIQYALSHPDRWTVPPVLRYDFRSGPALRFEAPDTRKFPCLQLAYAAARRSGSAPCVLSAADEVAVGAYLQDRIAFTDIPRVIERVLSSHRHEERPGLQDILRIHGWASEETRRLCEAH